MGRRTLATVAAAAGLWLVGLLTLAFMLFRDRHFIHDDAFISLRYARNLLTAGDLSWNPGDRVEGVTNLLHVLMTAAVARLGIDLLAAVRLVNGLALVVLLATVVACGREISPGPENSVARAVGGLLLLGAWPLALWTLGGLESVPLAMLIAVGYRFVLAGVPEDGPFHSRPLLCAGVCFALAFATRPDSVVIPVATAATFRWASSHPESRWPRATVAFLLPVVAVVVALTLWRLAYYGDPVPNTFYAKVTPDLGARLLNGATYVALAMGTPLLLLTFLISTRSRTLKHRMLPIASAAVAYLGYLVWSGGDHMEGFRLAVPVFPLAAMLAVSMLQVTRKLELYVWATDRGRCRTVLDLPASATTDERCGLHWYDRR